uniref:Heme-binding protein 1 n=2 Tax=Lepisosteus oculatus TaxID=7918 RepID=W5MJJ9_LEPOC
ALAGLAVFALFLVSDAAVGPSNSSESSFCTETKECLFFDLICKTPNYEVRHYDATKWVSTDVQAYFLETAAGKGFMRLYKYITGANEDGVKIDMTAPVIIRIPEDKKLLEPAVYTINFLLPSAYQEKAPKPTNEEVYFTDMPEMTVYVKSYGGWMLSMTSKLYSRLLAKELNNTQASYHNVFHYGVGYQSPMKLLNRRNEVWYISKGELVCATQEETPSDATVSA